MDNSSVEFYAVQDVKINTITNVVGSPSITIADDGVAYTLGNTISSGSKITVTSNIQSVIKLNITY
jgi:glucosamine 6-phosphate synthetase-like amidotransferase/phosphosugar isomerase protein